MSLRIRFLLVLTLLCLSVVGGHAIGAKISAPVENDSVLASCPSLMTDIIQSSTGSVYEADGETYVEPTLDYLVKYSVNGEEIANPTFEFVPGDLKDEQKDSALQNEAWQIFASLIPPQNRQMVTQYNVFTDGYSNTLAAVDQTKGNLSDWVLEIDVADLEDRDAFIFTLVHEYGHILTLNASQMEPDQEIVDDPYNLSLQEEKTAACPNYFTGMGCSHADAYINSFYDRFWLDVNSEWQKIDALQYGDDLNAYYAGLYNFYLNHQDQFVDDYSTTHPTEDIAESFAYFVFSPKPGGTSIKDQKVLFFYEYAELIMLRQSILQGACSAVQ